LAQLVVDREKLVAVLPESHPQRADSIRLASLKDENFVFGERLDWRSFRRLVDDECRKAGFAPNVTQEAATAEAVFSLVAVGAGVTLYLRRHGNWPGIAYSELTDSNGFVETRMIWREAEATPQLRSFLSIVGRVLG
jgi:DNA-binding transcriptional LysR family regulator